MNIRFALAAVCAVCLTSPLTAGPTIDQDNLHTSTFFSGIAVISSQRVSQVVTVGTAGTLSMIDVQPWQSPGTIGDVTLRVLSTTAGVPDPHSSGTLHSVVIPLGDLPVVPVFPPDGSTMPLTTVDVSAAGLAFSVGDQFAISLERVAGGGGPPWVLWGTSPGYPGGSGYTSADGESWGVHGSPFGFRTWVGGAVIPCPADLDGDGGVGAADLAVLLGSWGPCAGCPADLNGDGIVGPADLAALLGAWGPC